MRLLRGPVFRYLFIALVAAYLALTFMLPPNPQAMERYQISSTTLRLIQTTVTLPLIGIWIIGAYGYSRLREYGALLGAAQEAKSVNYIAGGLMVLALGQPAQNVASTGLRYLGRQNPSIEAGTIIAVNYLNLAIALAAFLCISYGVRRLIDLKKIRIPAKAAHYHIIGFTALSISYTYFVLRFAFQEGGTSLSYHMPLWLVLSTLVLPFVYAWSIGLYAAFMMYLYNSKLKGLIYRRGWMLMSLGLTFIIATSVFLQYLTSLMVQFNRLSITTVLLIVYGLLFVMAAGYILTALGAKRLQKIEEV